MPSASRRRANAVVTLLSALAVVAVACPRSSRVLDDGTGSDPPVDATDRPSIVLILTDDQRWDTLWAMPNVEERLAARGIEFTNGFVVIPLCCPSRASTLTGRYPHTTGVYRNKPPLGGFDDFDDASTMAVDLDQAGYRTGLIGKYLNGYAREHAGYVPPGWDRWFSFVSFGGSGTYFDGDYSSDGEVVRLRGRDTYSTDVIAEQAVDFIETTPPNDPLFLYFAPNAPHRPATPAPRHEEAFEDLAPHRPPSYDEADVSDKPRTVRNRDPLLPAQQQGLDALRILQLQSLLAVDEAVGRIIDALSDSGRLHETMIVFTSDNGFLWGEHRRDGKDVPYEESIRVPLVVRYDAVMDRPRSDGRLVTNVDLAPTFAALAGARGPDVEGMSFLPLLTDADAPWRRDFLIEHLDPAYCAIRNDRFMYAIYGSQEEELYDLRSDPYELDNLVRDPAYAGDLEALRSRTRELCSPPPPGLQLR